MTKKVELGWPVFYHNLNSYRTLQLKVTAEDGTVTWIRMSQYCSAKWGWITKVEEPHRWGTATFEENQ